jgi:hypothetical protein
VDEDEKTKRLIKEAITEWLDAKYTAFGKWTMHGFLAAALCAFVVFILWTQGWHK